MPSEGIPRSCFLFSLIRTHFTVGIGDQLGVQVLIAISTAISADQISERCTASLDGISLVLSGPHIQNVSITRQMPQTTRRRSTRGRFDHGQPGLWFVCLPSFGWTNKHEQMSPKSFLADATEDQSMYYCQDGYSLLPTSEPGQPFTDGLRLAQTG